MLTIRPTLFDGKGFSEHFLYTPKVYVGCSLTHASEEFVSAVAAFKKKLREQYGCVVLEFLGLKDGTPRDVWIHDIERCVRCCDLFIAICDYPSIGLGIEFGVQAMYRQKPIIATAHRDSQVTRLILDPDIPGHFQFERYGDGGLDEILPVVKQQLSDIREQMHKRSMEYERVEYLELLKQRGLLTPRRDEGLLPLSFSNAGSYQNLVLVA